jgi:hypothetical protein
MYDEIVGNIVTLLGSKPTIRQKVIFASFIIGLLTFSFTFKVVSVYLTSPRPVIQVLAPQAGDIQETETLLQGKVVPSDSRVTINGDIAVQNGDGTFSHTVQLTEGKNTINIQAQYFGKKSGLLYRANRILSQKEIEEKEVAKQKEAQTIADAAQKIVDIKQDESKILGMSKEPVYDQSIISTQQIQQDKKDGKVISGTIVNTTDKTLGWIKLTAKFLDQAGTVVGEKEGYATQADQYLAPQAEVPYAMPVIDDDFSTFELSVIYDAM